MTPRRVATLAAALGGTIVLAGGVIAAVTGLQGIKNIDSAPVEGRRADAKPVDTSEAEAEPVDGALPDLLETVRPKTLQIATASMPAQRRLTVDASDAATVAQNVKDKNFDPRTIAKAIGGEASRLKKDAGEWDQKLQEFEGDLKNSPNVDITAKGIDDYLAVLRAAASRLAPNSNIRATLRKHEDAIRDLAIRAEVHSNQAIRKTAGLFQQKTAELHAINRSLEDIRIRLVTETDRLQRLKTRLEFNRAAVKNSELLKEGEDSLGNVRALAADAQHLASDLSDYGVTLPHSPRLEEQAVSNGVSYPVLGGSQVASAERQTSGRVSVGDTLIRMPPSGVLVAQPPAPVAVLPSGILQPAANPQ